MKTTDLERSKRLKELGFKQDSNPYYAPFGVDEFILSDDVSPAELTSEHVKALAAGEMIEWLLRDYFLTISDEEIQLCTKDGLELVALFSNKECKTMENALADAVIWVMERKI